MTQETTPASDPRLDEWENLANAATPGPWTVTTQSGDPEGFFRGVVKPPVTNSMGYVSNYYVSQYNEPSDAAFTAASREAIPALIAMVRHLTPYVEAFRREERRADDLDLKVDNAEARATAAQARVKELEKRLAMYAIHAEYDSPGDVPEFCGWWCEECKEHVETDGTGHRENCSIHGMPPARALGRAET